MKDYVRRFTGDITFKEVFDKYGWNFNVTVTDHSEQLDSKLLNYLTAPNVIIWSAVLASAAIPGMFDTIDLMQKLQDGSIIPYDPSSTRMSFVDGSVGSDIPLQRIAELFNVNTFLVSQVNPYVIPFLSVDTGELMCKKPKTRLVKALKAIQGDTVKYFLKQLQNLGIMPDSLKGFNQTMNQNYKGHITIVPTPSFSDYWNILANVRPEDFRKYD